MEDEEDGEPDPDIDVGIWDRQDGAEQDQAGAQAGGLGAGVGTAVEIGKAQQPDRRE